MKAALGCRIRVDDALNVASSAASNGRMKAGYRNVSRGADISGGIFSESQI